MTAPLTTAERAARRPYEREWARQKRFKRWLAANEGQAVCQARKGKYFCGGELTMRDGHLSCVWCALKFLGLCRDCLSPVVGGGNSIRCDVCREIERNAAAVRYDKRWPGRKNEESRVRMARWKAEGDPRYHSKQEYRKAYRAANPDKVRVWRAKWIRSEKAKAWHRAYNRRRVLEKRKMERNRARGLLEPRYCLGGCGTVLRGRWKKCRRCKISKYVRGLEVLGKRKPLATKAGQLSWHHWPSYSEFKTLYETFNRV